MRCPRRTRKQTKNTLIFNRKNHPQRAVIGVYFGIPRGQAGHLVWIPSTNQVVVSQDVVFDEDFTLLGPQAHRDFADAYPSRTKETITEHLQWLHRHEPADNHHGTPRLNYFEDTPSDGFLRSASSSDFALELDPELFTDSVLAPSTPNSLSRRRVASSSSAPSMSLATKDLVDCSEPDCSEPVAKPVSELLPEVSPFDSEVQEESPSDVQEEIPATGPMSPQPESPAVVAHSSPSVDKYHLKDTCDEVYHDPSAFVKVRRSSRPTKPNRRLIETCAVTSNLDRALEALELDKTDLSPTNVITASTENQRCSCQNLRHQKLS